MNIFLRRLLITGILITGILLSNNVLAATPLPPYLDYVGDFNYCDGTNKGESWCTASGKPENSYPYRWLLTFSSMEVTQAIYTDGTYISDTYNPYGLPYDPILGSFFEIGNLYNDVPSNNLIFGPTQPSGGITGPVTFKITDGTYTYLTATLDYFIVTRDIFGTQLNPGYNLDNIYDITFDPNGNAPYSQYIAELESAYNSGTPVNFYTDFTFTTGSGDFTNDSRGTVQGQIAVTPEPVSSILFVTGGATLAFKHYRKRKKKCNS